MAFPRPLTSWSYSRYAVYEQCPAKFNYQFILKLPTGPKGEALIRGDAIHKLAEAYMKAPRAPKLAPELTFAGGILKGIRKQLKKAPTSVSIEDTWAFRKDWSQTRWDDWNGCWLRIKVDCAIQNGSEIEVDDWKTGKYRPDNISQYMEQLELYKLGALYVYGHIKDLVVKPRLIYLDAMKIHETPPATLDDREKLRKEWEARVKPMFNDKRFAPKPNSMCRWCEFRKEIKGPCKFG